MPLLHPHSPPIQGLYAVTDSALLGSSLLSGVAAAIRGGAQVVQYRDKSTDSALRRQQADALCQLCLEQGVTFIVNDDVELAAAVAADGVHLGREDGAVAAARRRLGREAIIGVSCYNSLARAEAAVAAGADYLAFGRFFPSTIKPEAVEATPELLRQARQQFTLPLVAIGGITADNGAVLVEAGATALAVISDLFAYPDPAARAHRYRGLFAKSDPSITPNC